MVSQNVTVNWPGFTMAMLALLFVTFVGFANDRRVMGFVLGLIAGQLTAVSGPLALGVTIGACALIWLSRWRAEPSTGRRFGSWRLLLAACVVGIVAIVGLTLLEIYPPVPAPVRINAWVKGWFWIIDSFLVGIGGGVTLALARSTLVQTVAAFALGWGCIGNLLAVLLWVLGSVVLVCDAGPACL